MTAGEACLPIDFGGPVGRPYEPFPESALEGSVIDRFDEIAERHAGRLAVQDMERSLTYAELKRLVDRIAAAVIAADGREGPVAILLPNDVRFPAAVLGVMAAGRGVVPLDADHPLERNRLIAEHSTAAVVVSAGALAAEVRRLFPADVAVVDIEQAPDQPRPAPPRPVRPSDMAYVLYTSGSTGAPKGVWHDHRNCLHDTLLSTNTIHANCEDRVIIFYSGVIAAMRRTFVTLLNGASLHILPARALGAPRMVEEIRARGITLIYDVPTLFRRIVGALGPGERLESVRMVRLAGDRVDWSDFDAFRKAFPTDALFGSSLGSTEVSSTYAHWYVDEAAREPLGRLPVGYVMRDLTVEVQDEDGGSAPDGDVGEFVVRSRYLALGYWKDPELTARSFSIDPSDPEARVFRTGDMGLIRPDGLLEFVGRKDQLIKLRGHRIEPAEVEAALRGCSGVGEAAVVVRRHASGAPRSLVAYVERAQGVRGLLPRHVQAMAARTLPIYMHPSIIFVVENLPRLGNMKLDRVGLSALDASRTSDASARAADPVVDEVARTFEQVLGCQFATPDDNLLSLGGDSLQAVDMALALERRFGVGLSAEAFGEFANIRALASWIGEQRPEDTTGAQLQ
jgi:amino acid adenylation domain-containing protein